MFLSTIKLCCQLQLCLIRKTFYNLFSLLLTALQFLFFSPWLPTAILSFLLQLKSWPQFLFCPLSPSVAVLPKMHSWAIYYKLTEKFCTLPSFTNGFIYSLNLYIKSSKVVHWVGACVYFFCMLLQISTHLSSFYCFEDAQLMSQIYYCTIFSCTKMTMGKVNCRRIVFFSWCVRVKIPFSCWKLGSTIPNIESRYSGVLHLMAVIS